LAGIWHEDLLIGLTWHIPYNSWKEELPVRPTSNHVAPSGHGLVQSARRNIWIIKTIDSTLAVRYSMLRLNWQALIPLMQ